jgi:hypothetical protein
VAQVRRDFFTCIPVYLRACAYFVPWLEKEYGLGSSHHMGPVAAGFVGA